MVKIDKVKSKTGQSKEKTKVSHYQVWKRGIASNSPDVKRVIRHVTTIWPSNCSPGHLSQRSENLCSHKRNPCGSFIHNSPKLETIQMSTNKWMDEQNTAHSYLGILFGIKKEQNTNIFCNMDELFSHARYKRQHTVLFHSHEMPRKGRFIKTE